MRAREISVIAIVILMMLPNAMTVVSAQPSDEVEDYMSITDKIRQWWSNKVYGAYKVPVDVIKLSKRVAEADLIVKVDANHADDFKNDFEFKEITQIDDTTFHIKIDTKKVVPSRLGAVKYLLTRNFDGTLATYPYVNAIYVNHKMEALPPVELAKPLEVGVTTWEMREHYGIDNSTKQGEGIKIAVLDTGVYINNSLNSYDTNKTFVYSVVNDDGVDRVGHGSHVISIINGNYTESEDGKIICMGLARNATVYSIKVLGNDGTGSEVDIIKGIKLAMDLDVNIISMSLGAQIPPYTALYNAIQEAYARGIIIVAAAGNDEGRYPLAPAAWDGVISVGSLDENGKLSYFSNLGFDVAAIGQNVTAPALYKNTYSFITYSGTSMATPVVSAIIADFLSEHPSYIGHPKEVVSLIKQTGDYNNPSNPKVVKTDILGWNNYYYEFPEISYENMITLSPQIKPQDKTEMSFSTISTWRTLGKNP